MEYDFLLEAERPRVCGIAIITIGEYDRMREESGSGGMPDDLGIFYYMGRPCVFEAQAERIRWAVKVLERMAH